MCVPKVSRSPTARTSQCNPFGTTEFFAGQRTPTEHDPESFFAGQRTPTEHEILNVSLLVKKGLPRKHSYQRIQPEGLRRSSRVILDIDLS
jgi:hypothetical protein